MTSKFIARLSQALRKNKTVTESSPDSSAKTLKATFGIGTLIDQRYHLEAEIGRGGMGIVYRAHDIQKDLDVALKIINLHKANTLSLEQFSREADITARLDHPHIVAVFETGTVVTGGQEPSPYIVMELVHGKGLDELRDLTYARIIDLGVQICEALAYAHGQGFVHRDLKPGNVLVEKCGFQYCVKLMDFGLARPRGSENLPTESNLAGTIFYLAPEVIAGQPADISSDLYALGAMLYEMITGRVPFSDFIDDQAILAQHLEEEVSPPSHSRGDVPPALESIVLRLLEKDPKDRFTSAQEVCDALAQVKISVSPDIATGNLPQLTVNKSEYEKQIIQITSLFETSHLVTILGDNEALALATGAQLRQHFPDGVWFLNMASLDDPASVLPAIASMLCVRENSQRALAVSLIECLREKHLLLLLNRCDHLLDACAQLAETILRSCPEVYILATSQQTLNIPGETCY